MTSVYAVLNVTIARTSAIHISYYASSVASRGVGNIATVAATPDFAVVAISSDTSNIVISIDCRSVVAAVDVAVIHIPGNTSNIVITCHRDSVAAGKYAHGVAATSGVVKTSHNTAVVISRACAGHRTSIHAAAYGRFVEGVADDTSVLVIRSIADGAGVAAVEHLGTPDTSCYTAVSLICPAYSCVVGTVFDDTVYCTTHDTAGGIAAGHGAAHCEVAYATSYEHTEQSVMLCGGVGHSEVGDATVIAVEMAAERSAWTTDGSESSLCHSYIVL